MFELVVLELKEIKALESIPYLGQNNMAKCQGQVKKGNFKFGSNNATCNKFN